MDWNYGDLLDAVAEAVPPEAPLFIHGERRIGWADASRRMNNLGRGFITRGAKPGDKLAFYLRNCPEYMEGAGAGFRARMVHVNVNYRYKPEEVRYILDNSDAQTLIYASEFRDAIAQIRHELPKIKTYVEVTDGDVAPFAERYEEIANDGEGARLDIKRSSDDMLFIYTGGTTGMPKGVMWRHSDLCDLWHNRVLRTTGVALPKTIPEFAAALKLVGGGMRVLPACPLMHGTGFMVGLGALIGGGSIVTIGNPHFDAHEVWETVARERVQSMAIVGDPFARPLLKALDEKPGHYDLTCMMAMSSSGAMWTAEVKRGLIRHMPQVSLADSFASTEAMGMGSSVMTKDGEAQTAAFNLLENSIVIDENDQPIAPGSGEAGLVALSGPLPVGYYKDPEKTAKTFRTIGNRRYSIPGDYARLEANGTLTLLGRGSNCINTAGEKVYPEEVEEALKTHPAVEDALVLGVPDETWGQAVTGVVKLANGSQFDEAALREHVRAQLAGYKTPKRIIVADVALRAPNGKADYKSAKEFAQTELGIRT
ncbi:MAG TPA: acyl-CoA synthetase [Rhizomicrobium sp.]|nr:acyl-CoA synthetase [Rhizomicrobium sp.]